MSLFLMKIEISFSQSELCNPTESTRKVRSSSMEQQCNPVGLFYFTDKKNLTLEGAVNNTVEVVQVMESGRRINRLEIQIVLIKHLVKQTTTTAQSRSTIFTFNTASAKSED